ncbi:MAG TPA: hypothetical protein VFH10_04175 [Nocardioides sp.]|uniref:hypothetical protein n=1 Tax=Nocardioides sp. TaxID=35761 RepID=UPI002D7EEE75|nr:hypothetical protein [Nocardioides sp.]HET6651816.1 hypothetical protein [Nocardioides sp.]
MGTLGRLTGFVLGLAVVFAAALAAGSWWGPTLATPVAHEDEPAHTTAAGHGDDTPADHPPGGLMRSQDGYSLDLAAPTAEAGADVPLSFTVTGPDGTPHTAYDVEHGKRLHLIVVRRDLTGYQHVHPRLDAADGTWSTEVDLEPGTWRVFADFVVTDGPALTLGTDLTVPGRVPLVDPLDGDTTTTEVDGYTVELAGDVVAGEDAELTLTVSRDGRPVTDLQPYLGAYGHLVALRDGDLAYLHVHPHESADAGPDIRFTAEVPSRGQYRLFLDFRHEGRVRTASFDVTAVQR